MVEILELNLEPPETYVVKGHNHTNYNVERAILKHFGDEVKVKDKYETWCHWCYGNWEGESKTHYCIFDDKYKGVRGGFPITVVIDVEYL